MCLADLGRVLSVDEAAGTAEIQLRNLPRVISLAPLVLEGRRVEPGNWVVVHTGLAVELMDESEAASIVARRDEMFMPREGS